MKRLFIIHGWGGYLKEDRLPWLEKEEEKEGFKVLIPEMPHTENPQTAE
ncbi:MAG: hypothetical protein PHI66_00330 [Candidatus Pacebacteria bacterium]|nr:hypothetical protein [Candidatus Paceibacterota bacterium]